ncbi:nucleotide exchange factor GrpE [Pseudanabaena sp. FACHB-2040]|uniref:nucleotide exchange factor GrpE n=1 Tax=Pseudanabaena sp. FACHB-2040 TaxID=2692859 RepID=UPI00168A0C0B|nr:nucleotide exchange factor GrpE [Pseudanabaena sp. FACHB-2040]MBD2260478.1 nucleotide exchange factor GrpE [Pseudanabaena sp. FACHB-2040]
MIDDVNRTDNPNVSSPESAQQIEELHEEDATIDIKFEGNPLESTSDAAEADVYVMAEETADPGSTAGTAQGGDYSSAVADLERQIEGLKAQLEDRTGQYMRIAADFENYRKRTSKEKEDLEVQIKGNTVTELLPVVDNFERARSHIKPQTEAEMTIHKSYQSVYKQLVDCLKRLGVSAMRAEGQEFDPNLHEAVMREPTHAQPEGHVLEEFVRGYVLGDRVLRHAMVKVAAAPESEPASSSSGEDSPAE